MPDLYSSTANPPPSPQGISDNSLGAALKGTDRGFLIKKGNPLSSLLILPSEKVRFETQEPEEKILVIVRQYWLTNIPWILTAILMFLAPRLLQYFPLLGSFPTRFQMIFVVVWYLIAIMFVFERFLAWFFNMTIITDERIVDIDFTNLTTKKVADADLDKIQDVTFTNSGAIGTIFNYGNVTVQTAAETVQFIFEDIPSPSKVADILQNLRMEEKQEAIEGRIR